MLLPLIFLAIIDEFAVGVGTVAILAAVGAFASGTVQLSYAELTRRVSRRAIAGTRRPAVRAGFAAQALAVSFVTFAVPNIVARIGGSPQHPVGNGLLAEQFPPRAARVRDQRPHRRGEHGDGRGRRRRRADDRLDRLARDLGRVRLAAA